MTLDFGIRFPSGRWSERGLQKCGNLIHYRPKVDVLGMNQD